MALAGKYMIAKKVILQQDIIGHQLHIIKESLIMILTGKSILLVATLLRMHTVTMVEMHGTVIFQMVYLSAAFKNSSYHIGQEGWIDHLPDQEYHGVHKKMSYETCQNFSSRRSWCFLHGTVL